MNDDQRHARIFGVLFIITFITSISALALFQPVLDDPAGTSQVAGRTTRSTWGRSSNRYSSSRRRNGRRSEPIARRQNETLAIDMSQLE